MAKDLMEALKKTITAQGRAKDEPEAALTVEAWIKAGKLVLDVWG